MIIFLYKNWPTTWRVALWDLFPDWKIYTHFMNVILDTELDIFKINRLTVSKTANMSKNTHCQMFLISDNSTSNK